MKNRNHSSHRIEARRWVSGLCVAWVLILLSVTRSEANASGMFPIGDGTGPIISAIKTSAWGIGDRFFEETKRQHTSPLLPGRPSDIVRALTAPHHEIAADARRSSL